MSDRGALPPSESWALVVPRSSAHWLSAMRAVPGLEVLELADEVWIRGHALDEQLDRQRRLIPGGRRLSVLADGQTVLEGNRVPLGRLPEGPWMPIGQWLKVTLPAAVATRPTSIAPVHLTVVPSGHVREPALLETSLDLWSIDVATAPQWRIDRWSFAASREGQVLVRGLPLPPIPGTQWVVDHGIAVPAGYAWSPAIDAPSLHSSLELVEGDLALLRPNGSWDRVHAGDWVRASRSAARATSEVLSR